MLLIDFYKIHKKNFFWDNFWTNFIIYKLLEKEEKGSNIFRLPKRYRMYRTNIRVKGMRVFERGIGRADNKIETEISIGLYLSKWIGLSI